MPEVIINGAGKPGAAVTDIAVAKVNSSGPGRFRVSRTGWHEPVRIGLDVPEPQQPPAEPPAPPPVAKRHPFEGLTPARRLWVATTGDDAAPGSEAAPLRTIQAAVGRAAPGTAIMVKAGTYNESINLTGEDGAPDAPVWLVSADGPQAAKITPVRSDKETLRGHGIENWVIQGFSIRGSAAGGMNFAQNGSTFTDLGRNLVIVGNLVWGQAGDGIKVSQAIGVWVLDNVVDGSNGEQGIDFVAVNDFRIAGNEVKNIAGSAGMSIVVKGGSRNGVIEANKVHHSGNAAIAVGQATGPQYMWPEAVQGQYEARHVEVIGNDLHDNAKFGILFMGAADCQAIANRIGPTAYFAPVLLKPSAESHPSFPCRNIAILRNIVQKTDGGSWLVVEGEAPVPGLLVIGNTPQPAGF